MRDDITISTGRGAVDKRADHPAWHVMAVLPAAMATATTAMLTPFFWNPPGWVMMLSHPATSRLAAVALTTPFAIVAPAFDVAGADPDDDRN